MSRNSIRWTALAAVALAVSASQASAQPGLINSGAPAIAMTATQGSYLTLTVSGNQSIAAITPDAINNFGAASEVVAEWNLTAGTSVAIVGYFASTDALTNVTNPGTSIPSSLVEASWNAGAFQAIDQGIFTVGATNVGVAGATRHFGDLPVATLMGSALADLSFRLNLVGVTPAAGTYNGTLNLRAVVQ
jgi:hypothetical protein